MKKDISEKASLKYIHREAVHNLESPSVIVPEVCKLLNPRSVLDVGCGIGTFLKVFEDHHIPDYMGVDGEWVKTEQLLIGTAKFQRHDLEKPFNLNRSFDLVVCLEVAEHLSEPSSDVIVKSLVDHGKTILFSAALKNQGGQNHINEQNVDYWQRKFRAHGYHFYDVFRPVLWNNENVQWWYRQNMFLVVHESVSLPAAISEKKSEDSANTYVHPELLNLYYAMYANLLRENEALQEEKMDFIKGKEAYMMYIKAIIKKCFKLAK